MIQKLESMSAQHHEEMCWFNRVGREIKRLQSNVDCQNKRIEYMHQQIITLQSDNILNKFIEDTLQFDASRTLGSGVSMSDIYKLYKVWCENYFSEALEWTKLENFIIPYNDLEKYLNQRFMPSKCGRGLYHTVYFGVFRRGNTATSTKSVIPSTHTSTKILS